MELIYNNTQESGDIMKITRFNCRKPQFEAPLTVSNIYQLTGGGAFKTNPNKEHVEEAFASLDVRSKVLFLNIAEKEMRHK